MNAGQKLRVGIAGYGVVGPRRRQFIDLHPSLQTVAVCDKSFKEDGTFPDGVRYFGDYRKLLEQKLDVLFVCLTHDVAPEVTILGLEAGLHVFCEKPPGRSVADIKRVREVEARFPKLKLKFGFNHRYHDSVKDALAIIGTGEMGKIINLRGVYGKSAIAGRDNSWRSQRAIAGGGILLDQGIHMVDLMLLFAGSGFTDIKSMVSNAFWNHDVEDNAFALMRTDSGIVAMLHSTATQWRHHFELEIAMTNGGLILSGILSGTKSYGQEKLVRVFRGENDWGNPKEQITSYVHDNSWKDEIFEFADVIINDRKVATGSSLEAQCAMETVYKIYCADTEWRDKYRLSP